MLEPARNPWEGLGPKELHMEVWRPGVPHPVEMMVLTTREVAEQQEAEERQRIQRLREGE